MSTVRILQNSMCHIPLPVKQETVSAFLIRTGRKVFNIKGDGNCLFRALSHQLFGTEDHHLSLRTSLVRYELFNKQHFQGYLIPPHDRKDISSHAIYMSAPDMWGTQVELKAAATMFGLPIYFLEKSARGYEWKVIHSLKDRSFLTLPQLKISILIQLFTLAPKKPPLMHQNSQKVLELLAGLNS